jgi:hypothetical protein
MQAAGTTHLGERVEGDLGAILIARAQDAAAEGRTEADGVDDALAQDVVERVEEDPVGKAQGPLGRGGDEKRVHP